MRNFKIAEEMNEVEDMIDEYMIAYKNRIGGWLGFWSGGTWPMASRQNGAASRPSKLCIAFLNTGCMAGGAQDTAIPNSVGQEQGQ